MNRRAVIALPAGLAALHAPAASAVGGDARLLELLHLILAAEKAEEAAALLDDGESSRGTDAPPTASDQAWQRLHALHLEMATIPAVGALGLAIKGMILARNAATGLTCAEIEVGESLCADAVRLLTAVSAVI